MTHTNVQTPAAALGGILTLVGAAPKHPARGGGWTAVKTERQRTELSSNGADDNNINNKQINENNDANNNNNDLSSTIDAGLGF